MAGNKHYLTVTVMCIKTEIASKMIRRIPEIEEKNVAVIHDNTSNSMTTHPKNISR